MTRVVTRACASAAVRCWLAALIAIIGLVAAGCGGGAEQPGVPRASSTVVDPPTSVIATDGAYGDRVRVYWGAGSGVSYYQVWRSAVVGGGYALIGTTTGTQYFDMQNTTAVYYYKVRSAIGGVGYSTFVGPDAGNAAVNAPANCSATDGAYTDYVRISWGPAAGAGYYQLWRSTSAGGTYTLLASPSGTFYNDYVSGTAPYYYKVRAAIGGVGYSGFAGPDAGNASLAAPTNVAASDGTFPDRIRVTWTAAAGAGYYQVWRAFSQNGSYSLIGTTAGTQFDEFWNNGIPYWYKVRSAVGGVGYSIFAGPDSGFDGP